MTKIPQRKEQLNVKAQLYAAGDYELLRLTEKQLEAIEILNDDVTRELLYGGAAGGGKSWLGCEWLMWNCLAYPSTKWFIGREELKRITQSTYITFQKVCKKHGLILDTDYKYNGQNNYIYFPNGSRIDLLDLKFLPKDEYYERFGSLEYTGGWIEEGGEVHPGAYDTIKTRINRHENKEQGIKAKLLITCNPKKNWMYTVFCKPFKNGTLKANQRFVQAFVDDNEHIHGEYKQDLAEISDESKKQRLLHGNWEYDDDPNTLIGYNEMCDLFTNSFIEPDLTDKWITADIALTGSDKLVIGVWYGFVLVDRIEIPKIESDGVIGVIEEMKLKHSIPNSRIIFDSDGVGAFVGGFLKGALKFVNNSKALKGENYENLKTQCYYKLADIINDYEMWLKCITDIELQEYIKDELGQVKSRDTDKDGKLKIQKKEDIRLNIGRSPDYSDMLMMRMYPTVHPERRGRRTR